MAFLNFLIFPENGYSQNTAYNILTEVNTLYYLPDPVTFLSEYSIANVL